MSCLATEIFCAIDLEKMCGNIFHSLISRIGHKWRRRWVIPSERRRLVGCFESLLETIPSLVNNSLESAILCMNQQGISEKMLSLLRVEIFRVNSSLLDEDGLAGCQKLLLTIACWVD
jgi:hypothetical protein